MEVVLNTDIFFNDLDNNRVVIAKESVVRINIESNGDIVGYQCGLAFVLFEHEFVTLQ